MSEEFLRYVRARNRAIDSVGIDRWEQLPEDEAADLIAEYLEEAEEEG